ncbi:MAG: hypothetical protein R3B07_05150 [Polyangiaceae bacterium]
MKRRLWAPALCALAIYGYGVYAHVARGEAPDLFWVCNVAPLVLALGCVLGRGGLVAISICWLVFGTPMWLIDLFGGGNWMLASLSTHLGGLAVGTFAARQLGWPRGSWLSAVAAHIGLLGLTRVLTPPKFNVNLVFAVWPGWEGLFPNHLVYLVGLGALASLTYFLVERIALRLHTSDAAIAQGVEA